MHTYLGLSMPAYALTTSLENKTLFTDFSVQK